jgi:flagellar assembly protein FliH
MTHESYVIKNESPYGVVKCLPRGETMVATQEDESLKFSELIDQERLKAYQMGKTEGEKIGYEKARDENSAFLLLFQKIVDKIIEEKKRLLEDLKPEVIDFAISCAERVIRIELSEPEKFVKLIDSFLMFTSPTFSGEVVKIILSPEDLVMIEGHLSKVSYDKKEIKGVRFIADPKLKTADFKIETKSGLLNFMVNRELEDLRSKILKA